MYRLKLTFILFVSILVSACRSTAPVDQAPAPLLDGLGDHAMPITTDAPLAQRYFNQGIVLAYGFNHAEAARAFRAAQQFDPDVVVANAGAAQFTEGEPITMTAADVVALCEATDARIVADHMDAINHCLLTRADLRAALDGTGFEGRVSIPEDGERLAL